MTADSSAPAPRQDGREHLGTLLVKAGIITPDALAAALREVEDEGRRLGEVLIEKGAATEEQIQNFLSIQLGYPVINLDHTFIDRELARSVPEKFARRHALLPLYRADTLERSVVVVAMTDPANIVVQDELKNALGSEIFVTMTGHSAMERFLDQVWGRMEPIPSNASEAAEESLEMQILPDVEGLKPSLAKVLQMLFNRCLELKATAVHLEPKRKFVAVRFKIDGEFHTVTSLPRDMYSAILSRIKLLAHIEIGESLIHVAEGRFHIRQDLATPPIDVRVTIVPAVFGEKVVMRMTRRSDIIRKLETLGFDDRQLRSIQELLREKHGLILISGKNDSGKTTLAYSMLAELEEPSKMVVTIEDPPEYPVSAFNQIAKTDAAGKDRMNWEETIRAVERQDPHIVYLATADDLSEMKAVHRFASTGMYVVTSLYANDATSTHWVPFQLGADPHAIASVLRGVVFCRLLGRLCPECRTPALPDIPRLVSHGWIAADFEGKTFYAAKGCAACRNTGYIGRTGIYEILTIPEHLREMIASKSPSTVFRKAAMEAGMVSIQEVAVAKAERGEIALEDLINDL